MKKKIIEVIIGIIIIVGLSITITSMQKKVYTEIDGVKYAILVNGQSATSFPSGNYKVEVECQNAKGYWNAITQKMIIKDIVGNISCCVSFNSISVNDYLNNYVIFLEGDTNQGDGIVAHETVDGFAHMSYSNWTTVPMTQDVDNTMSESNNQYTGTLTTNKSGAYQKFYPQSDGYYRMCYSIPATSNTSTSNTYKNYLRYYNINSTSTINTIYSNNNNGPTITGCYEYGNLTTTDYITIYNYYYGQNITVYFQTTDITSLKTEAGYRYEGANPNNYVWFNDELWRIIGVFGEESHGQTGKQLVKIIKDDSIGELVWDKNNINNWNTASLKTLLNNAYYNHSIDTNNCYVTYELPLTFSTTCDYTKTGIKTNYQSIIKNVVWYLGKGNSTGLEMYQSERRGVDSVTTNGNIGLMYASDYLYGAKENDCDRFNSVSIENTACAGDNWLYNYGGYTITTDMYNDAVITNSYATGITNILDANKGDDIYPVLYLSEKTYKVSGTGTITDPYIIGLASN